MTHKEAAEQVCKAINWGNADLAEGRILAEQGDAMAAVAAYVSAWKERTDIKRPWTTEYVTALREAATAEQTEKAQKAVTDLFDKTIDITIHDTFLSVSDDVFFLGVRDDETLGRAADKALSIAEQWPNSPWGCTNNQVKTLLRLLALPECKHQHIVANLAWLVTCSRTEWQWSKTWGESMLGDSGHNWWLHTFTGFYMGGLHFPDVAELAQFRAFAPEYFERELDLLMEDDGFTRERSGYHWGTVNHWLNVLFHTSCDAVSFPQKFCDKIRKVADSVWITALPHGGVPLWGDTGASYSASLKTKLQIIAATLQIPEMKYVAQKLFPDWQPPYREFLPAWGRNLWQDWLRLEARPPALPTADTSLPASKYFIMRSNWSPKAGAITFTAGPTGKTVTSHDHTHVGAIEMLVNGCPMLIDNSSGPYGDEPPRLWRVGSSAHNVATVDGQDHIPMIGEWRWEHPIMPTLDAWKTTESYAYCSVSHEGYVRLEDRVPAARRKLFWLRDQYVILIDRFTADGEAEHTYDIHFHLRGDVESLEDGRVLAKGEAANLLVVPVPGLCGTRLVEACPYPLKGYENPTHVQYSDTAAGDQIYVTLLLPFINSCPEVDVKALSINCDQRVLSPFEATALAIDIDGKQDVYFDQHMHWNLPWQAGGYGGTQRLFHSSIM